MIFKLFIQCPDVLFAKQYLDFNAVIYTMNLIFLQSKSTALLSSNLVKIICVANTIRTV